MYSTTNLNGFFKNLFDFVNYSNNKYDLSRKLSLVIFSSMITFGVRRKFPQSKTAKLLTSAATLYSVYHLIKKYKTLSQAFHEHRQEINKIKKIKDLHAKGSTTTQSRRSKINSHILFHFLPPVKE